MTTKYVMSGEVIDYVAGGTITSGQVVLVVNRIGVALAAIANGATGAVRVKGIFTIAKLSTDVVAQGDLLYWDAGNSRLTLTASTHKVAGYAAAAAGSGVTTVEINLNA
jgi:predicted RecA/RadA family phage recombinase